MNQIRRFTKNTRTDAELALAAFAAELNEMGDDTGWTVRGLVLVDGEGCTNEVEFYTDGKGDVVVFPWWAYEGDYLTTSRNGVMYEMVNGEVIAA